MADLAKHNGFTPSHGGVFMEKHGPAYAPGGACSDCKLCITATDADALIDLLIALARREDCFYVKYSTRPRDGMYLGRCFLTTDNAIGKLWAELKPHDKFLTSVQDDSYTEQYRGNQG